MKIHVKKLWKGQYVSVRDYDLRAIISAQDNLVIEHEGKVMTVPWKEIPKKAQRSAGTILSKYNNGEYILYDFRWTPDQAQNLELPI